MVHPENAPLIYVDAVPGYSRAFAVFQAHHYECIDHLVTLETRCLLGDIDVGRLIKYDEAGPA